MSNDNIKDEVEMFMKNDLDFGATPLEYELTPEQKKIAAMGMAVNATVIQLISEGIFPLEHQIHFMGHLQDFMDRIYKGESLRLPNVSQTLQVNSKAGNLFYEAANVAFEKGSESFQHMKDISQEMVKAMQDGDEPSAENSNPDLAKNRTLN